MLRIALGWFVLRGPGSCLEGGSATRLISRSGWTSEHGNGMSGPLLADWIVRSREVQPDSEDVDQAISGSMFRSNSAFGVTVILLVLGYSLS